MSVEIDSPVSQPKKHKVHKEKGGTSEKKRKRQESQNFAPAKKHRSKHHAAASAAEPTTDEQLDSKDTSPFYQQTYSLYLPLAPISQRRPIQGLCAEHLSPLLLTYYPPFHGVIISYANPRCTNDPHGVTLADGRQKVYARSIDEYAATFVWLMADFLIFKPQSGDIIEGYVNLQNEGNLGLVCWNFFNASIERKRLPRRWKWKAGGMGGRKSAKLKKGSSSTDEDAEDEENSQPEQVEDAEGHYQDSEGKKVEGLLRFRVKHVETSRTTDRENGFLSIEGTMLDTDDEKQLQELEAGGGTGGRRSDALMRGALENGYHDSMDVD